MVGAGLPRGVPASLPESSFKLANRVPGYPDTALAPGRLATGHPGASRGFLASLAYLVRPSGLPCFASLVPWSVRPGFAMVRMSLVSVR